MLIAVFAVIEKNLGATPGFFWWVKGYPVVVCPCLAPKRNKRCHTYSNWDGP